MFIVSNYVHRKLNFYFLPSFVLKAKTSLLTSALNSIKKVYGDFEPLNSRAHRTDEIYRNNIQLNFIYSVHSLANQT